LFDAVVTTKLGLRLVTAC